MCRRCLGPSPCIVLFSLVCILRFLSQDFTLVFMPRSNRHQHRNTTNFEMLNVNSHMGSFTKKRYFVASASRCADQP
ncbi:hypothetical protein FB192DRAFT_1355405 [Mucor lusitanicus]|uniref:Secreted protein n=1 Tax=Mucor circinelloides f. lusitanicus TaxID=29924 RepID=A0A8H4BRP4_MUCCL|nr:hypothetical protein FB192DRAFT_1355405 [Mucor lusitanicus]